MNISKAISLAALAVLAGVAHAQVSACPYRSAILNNIPQNNAAGNVDSIKTSNKTDGTDFAFYANFTPNNGQIANGYWLVVSPGPNPKGYAGELAIFYLDASGSTPKLTAYGYNGVNGDSSYYDGNGTGGAPDKLVASTDVSWLKQIVAKTNLDGSKTLGFRVDPTKVNNAHGGSWTGAEYGDNIGIWFHPVSGLTTSYGSDGYLTKFQYGSQGWVDLSGTPTECTNNPVPEPASALVLGLGIVGSALRRRTK